jgi:hypothetical protein
MNLNMIIWSKKTQITIKVTLAPLHLIIVTSLLIISFGDRSNRSYQYHPLKILQTAIGSSKHSLTINISSNILIFQA